MRSAFTLVEALIGVVLVTGITLAFVNGLILSSRRQAVVEKRRTGIVIARSVVDSVTDRLRRNPAWLSNSGSAAQSWTTTGSLASLVGPGTTTISPALDAATAQALSKCAPYPVDLTISPDTASEPGSTVTPELLRNVRTIVQQNGSPVTPALASRLTVEHPSLSDSAVRELESASIGLLTTATQIPLYDAQIGTSNVYDNILKTTYGKQMVKDLYIATGALNLYRTRVEAPTLAGFAVFTSGQPAHLLSAWPGELMPAGSSSSLLARRAALRVVEEEMRALVQAFRRAYPALLDFVSAHEVVVQNDAVLALNATLAVIIYKASKLNVSILGLHSEVTTCMESYDFVAILKVLSGFFQQSAYTTTCERLADFSAEFQAMLDKNETILLGIVQDSDATIAQRVEATLGFVELTRTRELSTGVAHATEQATIRDLANYWQATLPDLAAYLSHSEVLSVTALLARHSAAAAVFTTLRSAGNLSDTSNPIRRFRTIRDMYLSLEDSEGPLYRLLSQWQQAHDLLNTVAGSGVSGTPAILDGW